MPISGRGFWFQSHLSQGFGRALAAAIFFEGREELGMKITPWVESHRLTVCPPTSLSALTKDIWPHPVYSHPPYFRAPQIPYGCTVISFNNQVILNMSYFGDEDKVGNAFFRRLQEVVEN